MSAATLKKGHMTTLLATDPATGERVHDANFEDVFGAHRYIEANWNPASSQTVITASWGDESFDLTKTLPQALQDKDLTSLAVDHTVPACIGCQRLTRFATEEGDKPYVKQLFVTPNHPAQIEDFYLKSLTARGWTKTPIGSFELPPEADVPGEVRAMRMLQFQREADVLTITIHRSPSDDTTYVSTMVSD